LQAVFKADGRSSDHDAETEKVLGYQYYPSTDQLSVSLPEFEVKSSHTVTKRVILSKLSKIFDPLGLLCPVVVKGKALLRQIWQLKLNWDDPLPSALCTQWHSLTADLQQLNFRFNRKVVESGRNVSLVLFCDASKAFYGFTAYAVYQDESGFHSNIIFSKSKIAPLKSKSLPTLELLAVFLAFKCLDPLMSSMDRANIKSVIFGVDAQIVLAWILNGKTKTKNVFANNRLHDIARFSQDFESKFRFKCQFKYIPTEINPADLLTRGLSVKEFEKRLPLWCHGPEFLTNEGVSAWP
jgi:hypothetical protein